MGTDKECCSTQLIDGDGDLNVAGLEEFAAQVKLKERGNSYAVVSIMGLQSSGKSTLLNHLFGTNFQEMDACKGRSLTTKGIWLARGVGIEPCTLVMDLEGTDGRERGEDDTTFEKQSALFALAVSDIVLINIWCHNIGCEQAANRPLLKTIFHVMLQLFSPRKTTLIFVIRDKTRTPFEMLEANLREDVQKIWESVPKPQAYDETPLSEFFNVEVEALSSYEEKEEQFKEQVANLRQRFFNSTAPGGLAGDRRDVVPASGFSFSVQKIWEQINENKDLNLPAHMVLVATVRCEEIAKEKYSSFDENEEWLIMKEDAQSGVVPGFGRKLGAILNACLSGYDSETIYFDEGVRLAKRAQLKEKLLQDVQPVFRYIMGHLRSGILDKFKEAFNKVLNEGIEFSLTAEILSRSYMVVFKEGYADAVIEQANWVTSNAIEELQRDIDEHIASVHVAKLSELTKEYEAELFEALSGPLEALFEGANDETWPSIRKLLQRETESAVSGLSNELLGFDLDEQSKEEMLASLRDYARGVVEAKAREEAGAKRVLMRMKERFSSLLNHNAESMPGLWNEKEDIRAITKTAHSVSLKMLSVMEAIRLDDKSDKIENTLNVALLEPLSSCTESNRIKAMIDPLASSTWEERKSLWTQFLEETEYMITQATSAQKTKGCKKWAEVAKGISLAVNLVREVARLVAVSPLGPEWVAVLRKICIAIDIFSAAVSLALALGFLVGSLHQKHDDQKPTSLLYKGSNLKLMLRDLPRQALSRFKFEVDAWRSTMASFVSVGFRTMCRIVASVKFVVDAWRSTMASFVSVGFRTMCRIGASVKFEVDAWRSTMASFVSVGFRTMCCIGASVCCRVSVR